MDSARSEVTGRQAGRPREFLAMSRLLRHIDAPAHLVENELIADRLVEGEEARGGDALTQRMAALRVKAVVLAGVNSLDAEDSSVTSRGARQRAIVTRCDLRHEKHHVVAADLGISLREFYRERRRVFERLIAYVRAELSGEREPATTLPSRFELELDHVANLKVAGDALGAFRLLEETARATPSARDRVRAWCLGVELATDYGDAERSRRFFAEALGAAESIDDENASSPHHVELEMAAAQQSWSSGDVPGTIASSQHAVRAAARLPNSGDRRSTRVAFLAHLDAAVLALSTEDEPAEALRLLGDARRILDRMKHKPPEMLGSLLVAFGTAQWYLDGQAARSLEYLGEACAVLHNAGADSMLHVALQHLSETLLMVGDVERARAAALSALTIAEATASANGVTYANMTLATIESICGDPRKALDLANRSRSSSSGGLARSGLALTLAEAHMAMRHYDTALKLARAVRDERGVVLPERLVGRALRIEAEAYESLGDRHAAQARIEAAVDVLAKHGHQSAKQRAYVASARITGRREHAVLANELAAVLRPAQIQVEGEVGML